MNKARYTIKARLSPVYEQLSGEAQIVYTNESPDTLNMLVFHVRQNLNAEGNIRNRFVPITGGMKIHRVRVNGEPYLAASLQLAGEYAIEGTLMYVSLYEPLAPGETAQVEISWSFKVPGRGNPRMGHDEEVFFLGYWYPQLAVYDDLEGWKAEPYMANGEFYMDYADYEVALTVPAGWLVAATGELTNAEEILSETMRERLEQARNVDTVVTIVTSEERASWQKAIPKKYVTWHFEAKQVRDFAWATSNRYIWDATRAKVTDGSQEKYVAIHSFYRPEEARDRTTSSEENQVWKNAASYAKFAIEHLSSTFFPYPWPHMTVVEGVVRGGMEYPMITVIGGPRNAYSLFRVIYHEIGHMWFPMIVGQDEKSYAWMDEGLTTYNTNEGTAAYFTWSEPWSPEHQSYYLIAGTGREVEIMRHADLYPPLSIARGIASYNKPALVLRALEHLVGSERFWKAYRTYARRWAFKHPTPYDFFNTFEEVLGEDLDWFWTSWFYETWVLDHAIERVTEDATGIKVVIRDNGNVPMPVRVTAWYKDGRELTETVPVHHWLKGARQAEVRFPAGEVEQIVIDPAYHFPDIRWENNRWMSVERSSK